MTNMSEGPRRPQAKKSAVQRRSKRDRYTPVACNECKLRKVKCSGHSTCRRCTTHAIPCVYDRMVPVEMNASTASSNKENIQLKLSRMQASIDTLLQSCKPDGTPSLSTQPPQSTNATPLASADSRRGSADGSNTTMEDLTTMEGIEETMHHLSGLQNAMHSLSSDIAPPRTGGNAKNGLVSGQHSLWPLSRNGALEVIDGFREDIETLYPFIDLVELTCLLDTFYCSIQTHTQAEVHTAGWSDMDDSRNLDFLNLIIACGLVARGKNENDLGRQLMTTVEEKNLRRVTGLDIDMKDLAIATMLSVYCYQIDEITLAWRKIGTAARMCIELGLHKLSSPSTNETGPKEAAWVSKMFWCIYVLDRRYSFMTNLPFTFRDEDIDPKLPSPDNSSPFLPSMVSYGRLGAKIMPALPKLKSASEDLDDDTCTYLGSEIDRWIQSTTIEVPPRRSPTSSSSNIDSQPSNNSLETFCRIRGNQMRLSLYKHALHSPTHINRNLHLAHLAVHCAMDNIRILCQLGTKISRSSPLAIGSSSLATPTPTTTTTTASPLHSRDGSLPKTPHAHLSGPQAPPKNSNISNNNNNFFLVSSVAVLYLAIRNAPQHYSGPCMHEYFSALNLLRANASAPTASRRLRETVRTLERATWSLAGLGNPLSPAPSPAPMPSASPSVAAAAAGPAQMVGGAASHGAGQVVWSPVASYCRADFAVERQGAGVVLGGGGGGGGSGAWDGERLGGAAWADGGVVGLSGGGMAGDGGGGVGAGGGGMAAVAAGGDHGLWTFTEDMGWLAPSDSYFIGDASPQNAPGPGDYWPQG